MGLKNPPSAGYDKTGVSGAGCGSLDNVERVAPHRTWVRWALACAEHWDAAANYYVRGTGMEWRWMR